MFEYVFFVFILKFDLILYWTRVKTNQKKNKKTARHAAISTYEALIWCTLNVTDATTGHNDNREKEEQLLSWQGMVYGVYDVRL